MSEGQVGLSRRDQLLAPPPDLRELESAAPQRPDHGGIVVVVHAQARAAGDRHPLPAQPQGFHQPLQLDAVDPQLPGGRVGDGREADRLAERKSPAEGDGPSRV